MLTTTMSTEVQPPTPPPQGVTNFQHRVMAGVERHGGGPPMAFETQASRRKHGRSSSFSDVITKILPSRRPEKGHTLRSGTETRYNQAGINSTSNSYERSDRGHSIMDRPALKTKTRSHTSRIDRDNSESQNPGAMKRLLGSMRTFSRKPRDVNSRPSSHESEDIDLRMKHPNTTWQPPAVPKETVLSTTVGYSDEKEITKTEQMYEDKKTRRQQRRSLRESGDYLGVQGANPRTGYFDSSEATSSSEPSQMSTKTHMSLRNGARDVAGAQAPRCQLDCDIRVSGMHLVKEEKKLLNLLQQKREMTMKQQAKGQRRRSETGWTSVAEPGLSPIEQSLAGSPVTELAPADRLFPIPSVDDPTPYTDTKSSKQQDYFGLRSESSPFARLDGDYAGNQESAPSRPHNLPRKPVGSTSRRAIEGSTSTIVRGSSAHIPSMSLSGKHTAEIGLETGRKGPSSTGQKLDSVLKADSIDVSHLPFLGQKVSHNESQKVSSNGNPNLSGIEAIASSFQSASTSRAQIHRQLDQNLTTINPSKKIMSLNDLPPVFIRDPIAARDPLSCQIPRTNFPVWSPPTILETRADPQPLSTSTSITTITGHALHRPLPHIDGVLKSTNVAPAKAPSPQYKLNRTTLRGHSPQQVLTRALMMQAVRQTVHRVLHDQLSPSRQAEVGTSSAHQLSPTKQRSTRLCQAASAEREDVESRSIRTYISMFPRPPQSEQQAARNAAQIAFHHLQHPTPRQTHSLSDISDESKAVDFKRNLKAEIHLPAASHSLASEDRLVVQHPEPRTEAKAAKAQNKRMATAKLPEPKTEVEVERYQNENIDVVKYPEPKNGARAEANQGEKMAMAIDGEPKTGATAERSQNKETTMVTHPEPKIGTRVENDYDMNMDIVKDREPEIEAKTEKDDETKTGMAVVGRTSLIDTAHGGSGNPVQSNWPSWIWQVVVNIIAGVWSLVEHLYNSRSAIRKGISGHGKRICKQGPSFQDFVLILAAFLVMMGVYATATLVAQIVGMAETALENVALFSVLLGLRVIWIQMLEWFE